MFVALLILRCLSSLDLCLDRLRMNQLAQLMISIRQNLLATATWPTAKNSCAKSVDECCEYVSTASLMVAGGMARFVITRNKLAQTSSG